MIDRVEYDLDGVAGRDMPWKPSSMTRCRGLRGEDKRQQVWWYVQRSCSHRMPEVLRRSVQVRLMVLLRGRGGSEDVAAVVVRRLPRNADEVS